MTNYIYSTLTCDNTYHTYSKKNDVNDLNQIISSIKIKGGANVANKNVITNKGYVTVVSDSELELLENNFTFNEHKKNGFIIVDKKKLEADEVASNMTEKDKSAPKIPKDYKNYTQKREPGNKTVIMEKNEITQA